jgi:hypothetical protein
MVWLESQRLERKMTEKLATKKFEEEVYARWILIKGWPQPRRILITKGIRRPIVWIPLASFSRHSHHCPMGSWAKCHCDRNRSYTWMLQYGLLLIKANLVILLSRQSVSSTDQHTEPQYGTIPQNNQSAAWWQIDDTGPLPLWKG